MTGKRYYLTTLADWQRHVARFANSHFIAIDAPEASSPGDAIEDHDAPAGGTTLPDAAAGATKILALVEADEGAHLALEDDDAFEVLPHPLEQKPISDRAQAVLAAHGVLPGSTTFDAAEVLARVHPLLRHRVF